MNYNILNTLMNVLLNIVRLIVVFVVIINISKILDFSQGQTKLKFRIKLKYKLNDIIYKFNLFHEIKWLVNEIKINCNHDCKSNSEVKFYKSFFQTKFFSAYSVVAISLGFSITAFVASLIEFKLLILSVILSVISFFIPVVLLKLYVRYIHDKLYNNFMFLLVNLTSFSEKSNDIIAAFLNIKVEYPLKSHIDKFNLVISNGYEIGQAFDNLVEDINIDEISKVIYLLKLNYINGGNLSDILKESLRYFDEVQTIKKKQNEKKHSMLMLLLVIAILNILLIITFVLSNNTYKDIIFSTTIGKIIFDFNSFIYLCILLHFNKNLRSDFNGISIK